MNLKNLKEVAKISAQNWISEKLASQRAHIINEIEQFRLVYPYLVPADEWDFFDNDFSLKPEIVEWLNDNTSVWSFIEPSNYWIMIGFKNLSDATFFKLRWQ